MTKDRIIRRTIGIVALVCWFIFIVPQLILPAGDRLVWLWTWQALAVWVVFLAIMLVQVFSEEYRLHRDFGEEYDAYRRRTRRF